MRSLTRLARRALAAHVLLGSTAVAADAQSAAVIAFEGVHVIPMDRERVLRDQTVVVTDGRITALGPAATTRAPNGAQRVDARGKYLMPGLAEMHAHILPATAPGNQDELLNKDIFTLYLANGITTIRAMLGAPNQLVLRDRLARREVLGPRMFVAAPSLNGNSAPNPDTARVLVRAHKAAGYDLLKIHPGLSRATYDAMVATAREVGITFAGHVPDDVGVRHAIASKQSTIDHLDGYILGAVSQSVMQQGQQNMAALIPAVDEGQFAVLARATKDAGIWNVPTMFLWESFYSSVSPEKLASLEELRYATPQWRNGWRNQKRNRLQQDAQSGVTPELGDRHIALRRKMLKALADAGAPLLMGTDSPQMYNVPGFALHREIGVMGASGLTPFQVLRSGTANVARYAREQLKHAGDFGTVAVGMQADLVLLEGNPLEDLSNLRRRAGVLVQGRWLPASELQTMLEAIARKNAEP